MSPRKIRIQAVARRVIAFLSSCAPVSCHAGNREVRVRPDQADGQDRTALSHRRGKQLPINHVNTNSGRLCARPHDPINPECLLYP
jgi:hypothetical protein